MKHIIFLFCISIAFMSCAGNYHTVKQKGAFSPEAGKYGRFKREAKKKPDSNRKIVKNARMRLLVREADSMYAYLEQLAINQEGYVSYSADGYAVLQVKSEHLNEAMRLVGQLGKVKDHTITTADVTAAYTDYQIRIENAQKTRARYIELLKKAEGVKEILPLEKEIERLTLQIEQMKGQIALYDSQISYSKLEVSWQKKTKPGPIGYVFVGLFKAVKVLFVRG